MGRWEPDARGRLEQAAMELFEERGYARTTVEDIAARAGLTERTFFRYFTDKREVLFSGSAALEALIVETIGAAPTSVAPLTAVTRAFEALASWFESRRGHARKRRTVIAAYGELGERELIKLSTLAAAIATMLRKRGLAAPTAALVAEMGIAIFKNAFERWDGPTGTRLPHASRQDGDATRVPRSLAVHRPRPRAEPRRCPAARSRRSGREPRRSGRPRRR